MPLSGPRYEPCTRLRMTLHVIPRSSVHGTPGYGGDSTHLVHVGLGDDSIIDAITVVWPEGTEQTIGPVDADQLIEIAQAVQ